MNGNLKIKKTLIKKTSVYIVLVLSLSVFTQENLQAKKCFVLNDKGDKITCDEYKKSKRERQNKRQQETTRE